MLHNPIFLKGDLEFTVDDLTLSFRGKHISVFGVTGLPWTPLSSRRHFGAYVFVNIQFQNPYPIQIPTDAYIMREHTLNGEQMGLKFIMEPEPRANLSKIIEETGYFPIEYMRKYPRIPQAAQIQTYPLRALALANNKKGYLETTPIIFDVRNLSLGGILLSTENPFALSITPGNRMDIYIEPRGDFSVQILVHGTVCRVIEEINPESGNLVRYFGIKFTQLDEENRVAFLELLKDILLKIKSSGGAAPDETPIPHQFG